MGTVLSSLTQMLSFYVILLVCLSFSVEARRKSCQEGENAICGIEGVPKGVLNPCCKGFKCYKWNSDENGYSFCMNKTAALIPENGNCKGFKANCEDGLICDKRTKTCLTPVELGADCKESPCAKGLKCKEDICVEKKPKAQLGEDCSKSKCAKGLKCKEDICVEKKPMAQLGEDCTKSKNCAKGLKCKKGICVEKKANQD